MTEHLLSGDDVAAHVSELGVKRGGVLLVHASMRSMGKVEGGARTVAATLSRVLGPQGTLVVPSFTPENSDTSRPYLERVRGLDAEAREAVRARMPPYGRDSPAPSMGRLSETVRLAAGAERSDHPQTSFSALGAAAGKLTAGHRPDCHLGEDSPLALLYESDAQILLLGTDYSTCTAFHLAEYRVPDPPRRSYRCVVTAHGRPQWWEYEDVDLDDSDFGALGRDFERSGHDTAVRSGRVGRAQSRLIRFTAAVDFAVGWLVDHRPARSGSASRTPGP
ncbi:aminoglycoside N(3)-acetyltransferase [Streptomyces sp. NPDC102402]|uniref:aminoglycoside N(3)-acetyltransferase n=1 Tax=Streptomyces sp. NPDC102402 TaxID=3366169 RepID=UPI0037FC2F4D